MQLSWFRKPGPGEPGSLNLCYNALDRHVIRGRATDAALITADSTRDFATLLQQVAELAGALAALGVKAGDQVATRLADPADALLAMLACDRLGAVHGEVGAPTCWSPPATRTTRPRGCGCCVGWSRPTRTAT